MTEHRRMLLEDYRLSPEIVSHCSNDILEYCNGLEAGGRTIHCLMEHSRPKRRKDRVSPPCQRAVSIITFFLSSIKFKKGIFWRLFVFLLWHKIYLKTYILWSTTLKVSFQAYFVSRYEVVDCQIVWANWYLTLCFAIFYFILEFLVLPELFSIIESNKLNISAGRFNWENWPRWGLESGSFSERCL